MPFEGSDKVKPAALARPRLIGSALNCALMLVLLVLLSLDRTGSYGTFVLLSILPAISLVAFAGSASGKGLLGACWMGNAAASVFMALTALASLALISTAFAFALVVVFCVVFAGVQVYSAIVAYKIWKLVGKEHESVA